MMSNKGYETDRVTGIVNKIGGLYPALKWFEKNFQEEHFDNPKFRHFEVVDQIKGDFAMDYTKSYSHRVNRHEMVPEAVLERERNRELYKTDRYDVQRFTICWVVAVTVISPLSMKEKRYYYIVYRNKWFSKWANINYPSAKKWYDKDGITLKTDILIHSLKSPVADFQDVSSTSTLVLVTENTDIFYINLDKVNRLGAKGLGVVTDKWNQQVVGIPREMFSTTDVNDYK